jgi:hypothetical protein
MFGRVSNVSNENMPNQEMFSGTQNKGMFSGTQSKGILDIPNKSSMFGDMSKNN